MPSPARRQGPLASPHPPSSELIRARAVFGEEYFHVLEYANLDFPSWLSEFASSRELQRARETAGLPKELVRELLICALTLHTLTGRAPPPTNKEVRKALDRVSRALLKARALLGPPNLPYDIEERLPSNLDEVMTDEGEVEFVWRPTGIDLIRNQLDDPIKEIHLLPLPQPARHGRRISFVTIAVEGFVNIVLDYKPDIGKSDLVALVRTVLEPAIMNANRPDDAGVDWHGQVRRAIDERKKLNKLDV